jgi:hypothetical protein
MQAKQATQLTSVDDMLDARFGKVGTPSREAFRQEAKAFCAHAASIKNYANEHDMNPMETESNELKPQERVLSQYGYAESKNCDNCAFCSDNGFDYSRRNCSHPQLKGLEVDIYHVCDLYQPQLSATT